MQTFENPPKKVSPIANDLKKIEYGFSRGLMTPWEALQDLRKLPIKGGGDYWKARNLRDKILTSIKNPR